MDKNMKSDDKSKGRKRNRRRKSSYKGRWKIFGWKYHPFDACQRREEQERREQFCICYKSSSFIICCCCFVVIVLGAINNLRSVSLSQMEYWNRKNNNHDYNSIIFGLEGGGRKNKNVDETRINHGNTTNNNDNNIDTDESSSSSSSSSPSSYFSACLLIMDDNHFLIEWLAYHYHTLPLRRLIVAVDPQSKTSPTNILNRYRHRQLINITEWNDTHFLPFHMIQQQEELIPTLLVQRQQQRQNVVHGDIEQEKELEGETHETATVSNGKQERQNHSYTLQQISTMMNEIHLRRQMYFYRQCSEQLYKEGHGWTIYIDTDEYIVTNQFAKPEFRISGTSSAVPPVPISPSSSVSSHNYYYNASTTTTTHHDDRKTAQVNSTSTSTSTIASLINLIQQQEQQQQKTSTTSSVTTTTTDQHEDQRQQRRYPTSTMLSSPCIVLPRLRFGIRESSIEQISKNVPSSFLSNVMDFVTFRWRWRAKIRLSGANMVENKYNGHPKTMIDLRRIDMSMLTLKSSSTSISASSLSTGYSNRTTDKNYENGKEKAKMTQRTKYSKNGDTGAIHALVDIHRPIKAVCTIEDHYTSNQYAPFVVHHMPGTIEQWTYRQDPRDWTRTQTAYENLSKQCKKEDDTIRTWLQSFCDVYGTELAHTLLKDVGKVGIE